jgi:hypothetical protein
MDIPMLDEIEWAKIEPHLKNAMQQIMHYREEHKVSLADARAYGYGREALKLYFEFTGYRETNPDAIWHHRISLLGGPCQACRKPLRTAKAKLCAECGVSRGAADV